MKLKLSTIYQSIQALNELMSVKMKAKLAFKISTAVREINIPLEEFDKVRNKKIEEYGEKNDKGVAEIKPDSVNIIKFNDELKELLEKEEDINIETISINEFENLEIQPQVFSVLSWLIK